MKIQSVLGEEPAIVEVLILVSALGGEVLAIVEALFLVLVLGGEVLAIVEALFLVSVLGGEWLSTVKALFLSLSSLKSPIEASISEPIWLLSTLRTFSAPISRFSFFFGGDLASFLTGFFSFFGDFCAFGAIDFAEVERPFFPVPLSMKQIHAYGIKDNFSITYLVFQLPY